MSVSRWVIDLGLKMNELNVKEKAVEVSNINVQMKETSIKDLLTYFCATRKFNSLCLS